MIGPTSRLIASAPWVHFSSIDSTNRFLFESDCDISGTTCTASRQTGGYGRLGRDWNSPQGGLYISILFCPSRDQADWPLFSFAAALAMCEAIEVFSPELMPKLKWPNDILIENKKICGILSQCRSLKPGKLVTGAGLNVKFAPVISAAEALFSPTSLEDCARRSFSMPDIAITARSRLIDFYVRWHEEPHFFPELWNQKSAFNGKRVCIKDNGIFEMREALVQADGSLAGIVEGKRTCIYSGTILSIV